MSTMLTLNWPWRGWPFGEKPTPKPSPNPTAEPSPYPTPFPTGVPTGLPTVLPTEIPTSIPTEIPTQFPAFPTPNPTALSTSAPKALPTSYPVPPSAGYPFGIRHDIPSATLPPTCTVCYRQPYRHHTKNADLDVCKGPWVFVGAMSSLNAPSYVIGAYGPIETALKETHSLKEADGPYNGVYWYRVHGYSFGFAPKEAIYLNFPDRYDIIYGDPNNDNDPQRLSWVINGRVGGYRAGAAIDLWDDDQYIKVIFNCPSGCGGADGNFTDPVPTLPPTVPHSSQLSFPVILGFMAVGAVIVLLLASIGILCHLGSARYGYSRLQTSRTPVGTAAADSGSVEMMQCIPGDV